MKAEFFLRNHVQIKSHTDSTNSKIAENRNVKLETTFLVSIVRNISFYSVIAQIFPFLIGSSVLNL